MSGQTGYHSGKAAEAIVAGEYQRRGYRLCAERWRSSAGEIDLILDDGTQTVFVEVKKSRDFAAAAMRVNSRQLNRIQRSASVYLESLPCGADSLSRIDVALVDGGGRIEILENATMH